MKSIWLLFVCALQLISGAKILSIVSAPSRSHHNVVERLVLELAKRGHEVTFVTLFKQPKPVPNLREVIIPNLYPEMTQIMNPSGNADPFKMPNWMMPFLPTQFVPAYTDVLLSTPDFQKLIKSEEKYDVVLAESSYAENVIAGFAHKHKASLIAISVLNMLSPNYYSDYLVGDPAPSSYVPDSVLAYTSRMNFWERLDNTIFGFIAETVHRWSYMPKMDAVMRKHFGSDFPPLDDIIKNTSLVLVNHHFSLGFPRPHLPNVIEIGSYHVHPPKPLPTDLQKFFDESKEGVVYFSMGSHIRSAGFPKEKKERILRAFSRLKQDVLWKFEDDSLTDFPKNVKIVKWAPQSDILAHPNLKLFITHGGMLSTTEAVTRGVPIVGIPVGGDQKGNMRLASAHGFGVTLELDNLNEDDLYGAIVEVLNNPKYRENVKRGSAQIRDTPLPAIDTAMYWIEYVIRHKGAPHLRSAAQDLKWYQLYLLDVLGVIFLAFSLLMFISFKTLTKILGLFSKKNVKISKHKKKN